MYFPWLIDDLIPALKVDEAVAFSLFRIVSRYWISCLFYWLWRLLKRVLEVRKKIIHHGVDRRWIRRYGEIRFIIGLETPVVLEIVLEDFTRLVFSGLLLFSRNAHIVFVEATPRRAAFLGYVCCSWVGWLITSGPIDHVFFDEGLHKFVSCELSWLILLRAWQNLAHSKEIRWFAVPSKAVLLGKTMAAMLQ